MNLRNLWIALITRRRRRRSGIAFDVDVRDRRNVGRLQRAFDFRPVADDHDVHVLQINVALRDPQQIFLRHRGHVLRIRLIEIIGQALHDQRRDRAADR